MRVRSSNRLIAIAAFILALGTLMCPAWETDQDGDSGSGGVAGQIAQPDVRFVVETGLDPDAQPAPAGGDKTDKAGSAGQAAEEGSGPEQRAKPGSPKPQDEEIKQLINDLLSEDAKTARAAQERLKQMGTAVVPGLFDELVRADWLLKPALLEVLIRNGLNHARSKMKSGTDAEKIHAALLYELSSVSVMDRVKSPDYELMVEILLGALDTDDKYLRAAVALALTYEDHSLVFFEHLHRIIPALISSCDTDLIISGRGRENPFEFLADGIGITLDSLIGDRLAFAEVEVEFPEEDTPLPGAYAARRKWLAASNSKRQPQLDKLRTYWTDWWAVHKKLSPAEIGKMIIERNLRLLKAEEARPSPDRLVLAYLEFSLNRWTRGPFREPDDWAVWWNENKSIYSGPSYGKH